MGYAIAGYAVRRRRGQRQKVKLLKESNDEGTGSKKRKGEVQRKEKFGMSDLPIEIMQIMFMMSGNGAMYELNRYFHRILVPSSSLVCGMIREKYIWDPLEYGIDLREEESDGKVLLMVENVFSVRAIWDYLQNDFEILKAVSRFIPTEVYEEFMQKGDSAKVVEWWRQETPQDFPGIFYRNFEPFVYNRGFIRALSKFFILEDPYMHLKEFIYWFYDNEHRNDDEGTFFEAVELILDVARVKDGGIYSSEPLEALLHVLFVENRTNKPIQIFTKFLDLFYSRENANEHLSDPSLWSLLRSTSNMTVIDIIVNHGGQPHYGAFF